MPTTRPATTNDAAAIVALWNTRTADPDSCWYQSPQANVPFIEGLMSQGFTFAVVEDGEPVGFGFWRGAELIALCGPTSDIYYAAMLAYATDAVAHGAGRCTIGVRETNEMSWMNSLGVVTTTPIGFDPLPPDADPETRVPNLLEVTADLAALLQAVQ